MKPSKYAENIRESAKKHHEWRASTINLIASENIVSPSVREVIASDFGHRYAEGQPGERFYQGCKYIDDIEALALKLAKKLFKAEHVNVQPISGVIANLAGFFALTKPKDTIIALSVPAGGHISYSPFSAPGVRGLKVKTFPFNNKEMNIDTDQMLKQLREEKPKLMVFGGSIILFPHPVKEAATIAKETGSTIMYDGAHVLGLIAGGEFQDPLREGTAILTGSTHKTLPGPQGGIIFCTNELRDKIDRAVFPGLVSNHHLHHVAGLAITLAEMLAFAKDYAKQIVKNAQALGQALFEEGFNVLAEHKDFTRSHQVVVDVSTVGGGDKVAKVLEKANIITNKNLLPWDDINNSTYPSGIRLGVQELTRLGMQEKEMSLVAELMRRAILDGEKAGKVAEDVKEFRRDFQTVHYCFEPSVGAYKYVEFK